MIVLEAAALVDVLLDQPPKEWVLGRISGGDVCAPALFPRDTDRRLLGADPPCELSTPDADELQ